MVRAATCVTVIVSTYATWPYKEGLIGMAAYTANGFFLLLTVNRDLLNVLSL